MTGNSLARLCRTWQRRLRLQDWRVDVGFVPAGEMDGDYGRTEYDETEQTASISVSEEIEAQTVERTLIHELLHLRLCAWDAPQGHPPMETAINLLADALYAGYRRRRRTTNDE